MAASDRYSPGILLQFMNDLWFRHNIVLIKTVKGIIQAPTSEISSPLPPPSMASVVLKQSKLQALGGCCDGDSSSSSSTTTTTTSFCPADSKLEGPRTQERTDFVIKHRRIHLEAADSATSKIKGSFSLSSPGAQARWRRRRRLLLPKMSSCKSFAELEREEIKGFMDLGFVFKEDQVTDRVMSVIPGLSKLGENKKVITRPYLSEAWLINRPNSPLLNLKIPPISAASGADMKKHLRFWAKTVADELL
ncbi:hypothetical protein H6P81_006363 [Aristolochia fimbriata]|uniref:Uncharacterized protein n=1 Tax=Aristolochia fimbriata TaxID=158543 RepID=A0AAV7EYG7_ARIFI|nr:hypothetical protein H6P81_006363 [Aristolochia fimbriata]